MNFDQIEMHLTIISADKAHLSAVLLVYHVSMGSREL